MPYTLLSRFSRWYTRGQKRRGELRHWKLILLADWEEKWVHFLRAQRRGVILVSTLRFWDFPQHLECGCMHIPTTTIQRPSFISSLSQKRKRHKTYFIMTQNCLTLKRPRPFLVEKNHFSQLLDTFLYKIFLIKF